MTYQHSMDHALISHSSLFDGSVDGWFENSPEPCGEVGNAFTPLPCYDTTASRQPLLSATDSESREATVLGAGYSPASSSLSPRSVGYESACDKDSLKKHSSRERGRILLKRNYIPEATSRLDSEHRGRSACVPHKQVERKYREGLNMEFERLRRAVPTLPQSLEANVIGAAKPSKGMVLAAATDYINRIERERDAAMREVERLGGGVGFGRNERYWVGI